MRYAPACSDLGELLLDLSSFAMICLLLSALVTGFSKLSIGGMGIITVPVMVIAFPGLTALGIMLPLLIVADLAALLLYRQHCDWRFLTRVLPLLLAGLMLGYLVLDQIPQQHFSKLLGALILIMLAFSLLTDSGWIKAKPDQPIIGAFTGLAAGFANIIANAAGPLLSLYMLQCGLSKKQFVGTRSWFFIFANGLKAPFILQLGLLTEETLKLSLLALPMLLTGMLIGYYFLQQINMEKLKWFIRLTAAAAATNLLI